MLEEVDSSTRKTGWAKVNSFLLAAGFVLPFLYHRLLSLWWRQQLLLLYRTTWHGITSLHNEGASGTCMSACMLSDCCENEK